MADGSISAGNVAKVNTAVFILLRVPRFVGFAVIGLIDMNVLSLFNGMSVGRMALDDAGIKVDKYYSSEIDKYAIKASEALFPDTIQLGSVTEWRDWVLIGLVST